MKFLIAKNDKLFCQYCKATIHYGEHYVGIFYKRNFQGEMTRNRLILHVDCYMPWTEESFTRRCLAWKTSLNPPKKRGRPKIYKDGVEANRLKTLITYYKMAGIDEARVIELEARLRRLKI